MKRAEKVELLAREAERKISDYLLCHVVVTVGSGPSVSVEILTPAEYVKADGPRRVFFDMRWGEDHGRVKIITSDRVIDLHGTEYAKRWPYGSNVNMLRTVSLDALAPLLKLLKPLTKRGPIPV